MICAYTILPQTYSSPIWKRLYLGLFERFMERKELNTKNNSEELAQGSDAQQGRPDFKI